MLLPLLKWLVVSQPGLVFIRKVQRVKTLPKSHSDPVKEKFLFNSPSVLKFYPALLLWVVHHLSLDSQTRKCYNLGHKICNLFRSTPCDITIRLRKRQPWMKRWELPVERRLEGDPEVLLKLEVPRLKPIFACGRGQTLVALESLQRIV